MPGRLRGLARFLFEPPEAFRVGPFREEAFGGELHRRPNVERNAAWLGLALGVAFTVCFLTGVLSHLIQDPPGWFVWPSRPAGLYRITQGVHVATGIASIPLLFAKLWTVYPRLWRWPPVESVAHLVERVSLLALVGGSVFMVATGLINVSLWYPFGFAFPGGHFWGAWITIGGLVVHVGAKWGTTVAALRRGGGDEIASEGGLSRRGFLRLAFAASAAVTAGTIGQTVRPLERLAVIAPRRPSVGPQGLPVNKTAAEAAVRRRASDPDYRLGVGGAVARPLSLSLADLEALPQREAVLPIACVEGWSANARWGGVPVRDLLDLAGAAPDAEVTVESLQEGGAYRSSELNRGHAHDPDTLLALRVNGERLALDHGFPARLIGPNRPGVMQTKWVARLVVR
ncbi:MAG: molybdopterin-dependent oxidoreductase [Actinomycetota bacterium]